MTTTDVLTNAQGFREQTSGLTRAQQLQWFGRALGIDEGRLLELIGYPPTEVRNQKATGVTFEKLADTRPEQTLWVTELFRELADRSGYAMPRLRELLHTPRPARPESGKKIGTEEILREIQRGGPDVLELLTDYLRPPLSTTRNGKRPTS
jgi:hypothetical protein